VLLRRLFENLGAAKRVDRLELLLDRFLALGLAPLRLCCGRTALASDLEGRGAENASGASSEEALLRRRHPNLLDVALHLFPGRLPRSCERLPVAGQKGFGPQ